jgi:clan AA aspartic protease (TIGR02281 family)
MAEVNRFLPEIEASTERLSQPVPRDAEAVARHNRQVDAHNVKVQEHRERVNAYNERQKDHNRRVEERNAELRRRERELDAVREAIGKEFQEHQSWRKAHGDERLFREVNQLYAALHEALPEAGASAGTVKAYLNQVRLMRKELATYARRREQEAENGVLIVPAMLSPDEECHLVVDTGATTVTVSHEMVRVLGLTGRLGNEVEVSIAGGLRARGREIVLPRLSVQGMEARDVDAIQLEESQCGVDGLLGLSYLNHFNYMVEREKPQRLRLNLKGEALDAYDVFISYNSQDAWWARVVFDALTVMRYRPFLSDVSLREMHDADFGKAIESAVSAARHMVVVGTSPENLTSPWVEKEWRLFIHLQLTHRKTGNVIAVPCGDMTVKDLPPALGYYQAVPIFERDFRERLRDFLPLL